jgi:hypothetical protein
VALSQARILYQNHSGDYPQVILTIPVTCRTSMCSFILNYILRFPLKLYEMSHFKSLSPACLLCDRVPGAGGGHPNGVRIQTIRGHQAPAHPSLAQPSSHCCRVPGRFLRLLNFGSCCVDWAEYQGQEVDTLTGFTSHPSEDIRLHLVPY